MSIARRLNEIVAAQFKVPVESIRPDTDFHSDLEADALDMPELAMEVEEAFDIMLDDRSVDALRTVRDLQDYVERSLEEKRLFRHRHRPPSIFSPRGPVITPWPRWPRGLEVPMSNGMRTLCGLPNKANRRRLLVAGGLPSFRPCAACCRCWGCM